MKLKYNLELLGISNLTDLEELYFENNLKLLESYLAIIYDAGVLKREVEKYMNKNRQSQNSDKIELRRLEGIMIELNELNKDTTFVIMSYQRYEELNTFFDALKIKYF